FYEAEDDHIAHMLTDMIEHVAEEQGNSNAP
ncbi:MAG: hypothetical protein K0R85_1642, partial [Devosia sp.]|nr:hypothetical protein [Devosia sp.]